MTYSKWKLLADEGYSSDVISFLSFLSNGEELDEEHVKTKALLAFLERKELVVDGKISVKGLELLENSGQTGEIPKVKKTSKFEEWWKTFPSTDTFSIDGREFLGSRSMRIKKDVCKKTFDKLVNEGLEADDIINATAFHILQAKKLSSKQSVNKLSFVANSERYIRERMFEPYIQMSKSTTQEPEFKSNIL